MKPDLNQPDGLHPNARGVAVIVERIAPRVADAARRPVMSARFAAAFAEGDAGDPRRAPAAGSCPKDSAPRSACSMSASRPRRPCRSSSASWPRRPGPPPGSAGSGSASAPPEARSMTARPPRCCSPTCRRTVSACSARPTTRPPTCRGVTPAGSRRVAPTLALVHGDPRCPDLLRATVDAAAASGAFLVGGLMSHNSPRAAARRRISAPASDNAAAFGAAGICRAAAGARDRGRDRADAGLHADRPGAPHRRGARQCRDDDRRPPGARVFL